MKEKILFVSTRELCYYSGSYFLKSMCDAINSLGDIEAEYVRMYEEEDFVAFMDRVGQKYKAVVDVNSKLPYMILEDDTRLLDKMEVPFYNYILDHPLYHHPGLAFPLNNYHAIGIDKCHVSYMSENYNHLKSVDYLPIGVETSEEFIDYDKRGINLLIPGTYEDVGGICYDFKKLCQGLSEGRHDINYGGNYKRRQDLKDIKLSAHGLDFYNLGMAVAEEMLAEPDDLPAEPDDLRRGLNQGKTNRHERTMESCVRKLVSENDLREGKYFTSDFPVLMNYLYLIDKYVRNVHRKMVAEELVKNKISVTIAGAGWEMTDLGDYNKANYLGQIDISDTHRLMENAKAVLDVNPLFVDGRHDRVSSAVTAGAYVISDMAGGNYNIWQLDKMIQEIQLPDDKKEAEARKNYKQCKDKYSWEAHAANLLNILKD
ncbi:MAG: hypothetical protein K6B67_09440 [Lachnospiraceae bacterium]|nr:hypothetical protein [Lachnospiraceae bacterium]